MPHYSPVERLASLISGLANLTVRFVLLTSVFNPRFGTFFFKIYYADTGLLVASLDDEAQVDLRANRNLSVYKNGIWESSRS